MTTIPSDAPLHHEALALDRLALGRLATIAAIDWSMLAKGDASRLKQFGFDEGVKVEALHTGPFGKDPLAVRVGRMTVAIRRRHAAAVRVIPHAA